MPTEKVFKPQISVSDRYLSNLQAYCLKYCLQRENFEILFISSQGVCTTPDKKFIIFSLAFLFYYIFVFHFLGLFVF